MFHHVKTSDPKSRDHHPPPESRTIQDITPAKMSAISPEKEKKAEAENKAAEEKKGKASIPIENNLSKLLTFFKLPINLNES